jgi:hypothetical protein
MCVGGLPFATNDHAFKMIHAVLKSPNLLPIQKIIIL